MPLSSRRIALAQFRPRMGDLQFNAARILGYAQAAAREGAALLLCPEMALLGYPPDDLLLRPALQAAVEQTLDELARALPASLPVLVGAPEFAAEGLYNALYWLERGQWRVVARKSALPNFGVFDERRHFVAGAGPQVLDWQGCRLGLLICEDLWDDGVCADLAAQTPDLVLCPNASPFDQRKREQRQALLARRSRQWNAPTAYLNLVGGQDELVFDGNSQCWDAQQGAVSVSQAPTEALLLSDWEPGRWRPAVWNAPPPEPLALLSDVIALGLRDYFRENGFAHVYVGLSGGIDSALVLALAVQAVGSQRVTAVAMPSPYTAQMSLDDARLQAQWLGTQYLELPIQPMMQAFAQSLAVVHQDLPADTTEENIQARSRGTLLMALANKGRGLVLATGNKSELAVGYCTLYGDMCGGFAPIKDLYKMQVYALARAMNLRSMQIPERVITRAPSAELRPDQRDEDSLPPYAQLDAWLEALIEEERSPQWLIAQGAPAVEVHRVTRLLRLAEFKRRQAAPGPKLTPKAFGRERRYPISAHYPLL